ncbi:MAG: glycosyltransferase family 4 protein, partial [Rhizobiales bacterium]|nr:glycosyltransferase family 4 protein [Hyphomicrobiales bacterium]
MVEDVDSASAGASGPPEAPCAPDARLKILVIASLTRSLVNFRRSLLEELVASGPHDVVAAAPEPDSETVDELSRMGVGFRVLPMARASTNPFADLRTLAALIALFRRERPDVVLAYTQKPIIYGGLAARLFPRVRYFAMQSGLGYAFSEENKSVWFRRFVALLYRFGIKRAEAVFVFNGDDERDMRALGILHHGQKVVQVPGSGVDLDRFRASPVPAGAPTFLLIARLMKDKGLYEFIDAARRLRSEGLEARFQILGPFDANPAGISAAELDAVQREGVVEYLGETKDVRPYLAASSVFVLPSFHREGLPRSILEAMATGRAIVTTTMPGCRETVVEGENGILVPPR